MKYKNKLKDQYKMTNNPFKAHGVEYLSPSSLNQFASNPAKWLTKVAGYRDYLYKPPFTYGNAIELGINEVIMEERTIPEAIDAAMEEFYRTRRTAEEKGLYYDVDACSKKQSRCADVLTQIIPQYQNLGTPIASQRWVEWRWDDFPIPIRGILDFEYEDCVRDLKTTSTRPKGNTNYDRQLTFYALATGKMPIVDYVYTLAKSCELISFDIQDVNKHVKDIKRIAMKMQRILSISSDIEEVCYQSCLEPDLSNNNWYDQWGYNEAIGAKKLFF